MDFNSFLSNISKIKNLPLGGINSQMKMAPELRKRFSLKDIKLSNPKESAILALLYPDEYNKTQFLLMQRASYNGVHSSQISFPGGKKDTNDLTLLDTALRETEEEIGVSRKDITIIRELTKTYIPPSNFWVTPFIGFINRKPIFRTNEEVEKIIEVNLSQLTDDQSVSLEKLSTSYMKKIEVPCFNLNDHIVWGATAMMLSEIKDILKQL